MRFSAALCADLFPLTKPATITTSMGNIIRQIATEDGKVMSASHELEGIIPPLVKAKHEKRPNMEIRVFALVYPPKIKDEANRPESSSTVHGFTFNLKLGRLLLRGARLYRVTSGGAGWGNKAGLLSLESTTQLHADDDADQDIEPSFDFQTNSIRMPGSADLFPPGYIVRFVGNWHDPTGGQNNGLTIAELPRHSYWRRDQYFEGNELQNICVGTTIVPEPAEGQSHSTNAEQAIDQIFCPNRFGFLAASSMSLSTESLSRQGVAQQVHSTLFDVPNSAFITTSPASGVSNRAEHSGEDDPWALDGEE